MAHPSQLRCPACQAELPSQSSGGLCPACLLESAVSPLDEAVGETECFGLPSDAQEQLGDYVLLNEIGQGGQGIVYRARHVQLQRDVALKVFRFGAGTSPTHAKRFQQEAQVTAQLDHPAIVPVYGVGEEDGRHFLAMKLIDGVSLHRLPADAQLSPTRAVEIIAQVARAIHHAHEHGVLHRDLKPGNILLDAGGRPYVTDFGLAKLVEGDSSITQSTDVLGTPSYMAPEMVLGDARQSGRAADVYGLGAVLYFLLSGRAPFSGANAIEIVRRVVDDEPPRLRRWNPKLDRDLELVCLKCLEKDPVRRYSSAAALADDLERYLRQEPVHARRRDIAYRARKWIRRHRISVGVGTVLVASACVIAVLVVNAREHAFASELNRAAAILQDIEAIPEDYVLAEDILKGVLARRPADAQAVTLMAQVQNVFLYRGLDRSDERKAAARRFAERAVQLAPEDGNALGALAVVLIEQRTDFARAETLLDRALALKPDEPFLHRFRVNTLWNDKRAPEADIVAAAEKTAARFPHDALAQYQLARIYRDSGRIAEMETYLDRTIALAPVTNALVYKAMAALWLRGDVAEMKRYLDRVTPRIRSTERLIFMRWIEAMVGGEWEAGIDALQALPQDWVEDWMFTGPKHLLTAQLLEQQGNSSLARLQFEAALAELRERQSRDSGDAGLHALEAWVLAGLSRHEEARADFRDYYAPQLPRPYRVDAMTDWWFSAIPCALLVGERAIAVQLIREAVTTDQATPENPSSTAAPARAAIRRRLQLDPRMTPWRDDAEISALLADPAPR